MSSRIVLDTGPLSRLCSPHQQRPENRTFQRWVREQLAAGVEFCISEIVDYEVRRGLLKVGASAQVLRLDGLQEHMTFLPLSREAMLLAARLWAEAQQKGIPTADPRELDCDVLLAAQAVTADAAVATENVGHLSRFVTAFDWRSAPDG